MSSPTAECYLGLGSNLGDPVANIKLACDKLASPTIPALELLEVSPLYTSSAMTLDNSTAQGDYVNAVAKCALHCPPPELLSITKALESAMGRAADRVRWAARVIDLDILFIKDVTIQTADLQIPHPGLTMRPFVLYPLRDLAPDLQLAPGKSVSYYADKVKDDWNTTLIEKTLA